MAQNILFICSQNWHRSKTAETIFSKQNRFNVRSSGTNSYAETPLSIDLLNWADNIFVMEDHHKEKIINKFPGTINENKITVLHIPDQFRYMDPDLINLLNEKITELLPPHKIDQKTQ